MPFNPKNYQFSTGEHYDKQVIFVHFPYTLTLKFELRQKFPSAKWSASKQCWYLPDVAAIRTEIGMMPKIEPGKAIMGKIHPVNLDALKRMRELLLLKAYSPHTVKTYCIEFSQLLYLLKDKPVDSLTPDRLRAYFLYCVATLKLSESIIHSRMNAIKFYFKQVLPHNDFNTVETAGHPVETAGHPHPTKGAEHSAENVGNTAKPSGNAAETSPNGFKNNGEDIFADIPRPKKKSSLPKAFSKQDISKIFARVHNPKHLLMLKLCYGMGLRVSEIVGLKVEHIDSGRMLVHIENAKGKRDRYVTLPSSVLDELRGYYRAYRPKVYLFEGQYGGQYSIRSVQAVFKNAMRRAKINKSVGIHGLRHSYATHLLECGTDMFFIQKLLGHKDIKTTEIYTKVSNRYLGNITSPLDTINQ